MFQLFLLLLEGVYLFLAFKTSKMIYFIVAFGIGLWWLSERSKFYKVKSESLRLETVNMVEKYSYTRYMISTDFLRALLIDEDHNKLTILEREDLDSPFEVKEYAFEELYEIAIVEDGKNIALTSVGGVHGWSLIDGGAKIDVHVNGETTDTDKKDKEIKKLMLKMVVDDLASPIIEYIFWDNEKAIPKESEEYKDIFKECSKWYQKISIIIKRNEQESDGRKEIEIKAWT